MSLMSLINCILWSAYGFEINNPGVYLPNVIGFILSAIQISLIVIFTEARKKGNGGSVDV